MQILTTTFLFMIIHEGSTSEKKDMVFIGETIRISVMGFYSFFQQGEQPVCCGAGEHLSSHVMDPFHKTVMTRFNGHR